MGTIKALATGGNKPRLDIVTTLSIWMMCLDLFMGNHKRKDKVTL